VVMTLVAGCGMTAGEPEDVGTARNLLVVSAPDAATSASVPAGPVSESDAATPSGVPAGYVYAPIGWVHPSCLHAVPSGASIDDNDNVSLNGQLIAHYDRCQYAPVYSQQATRSNGGPGSIGWIEYAEQNATITYPYDEVLGNMNVPTAPTNTTSTLYYWQGLTSDEANPPSYGCGIVQPVLQWGGSPAGGGNYWSMASWWWSTTYGAPTNPNGYYSTLVTGLTSGSELDLTMLVQDYDGLIMWYVDIFDERTSEDTYLVVPYVCAYDDYIVAFENQNGNLTSCTQVPEQTNFYNVGLFTANPSLFSYSPVSTYGPHSCWPPGTWDDGYCNPVDEYPIASSPPSCNWHIENGNSGGVYGTGAWTTLYQQ
jgi:hypothetical protein